MRKLSVFRVWLLCAIGLWVVPIAGVHAGAFYQGVSPATVFWPGGTIPYKFDTNYPTTAAQQALFVNVLREWELAANIHLVPYTNQSNYILLQYNQALGSGFCLLGTPMILSVAALDRGYAHEMGHALGLDHEHQRTDRTNYITVTTTNIFGVGTSNSAEYSFGLLTNDVIYGAYDLESIMHYGPRNFAKNPNFDVLTPLPAYYLKYYYRMGGKCLSVGDFAAAAYLYGAPTTTLTNVVTNTLDVGFGTLRAAIYYANIHPGTTIHFNIPTGDSGYSNGVWTIKTTGELPPLVGDGTIIDGSTQPGFVNHPVVVVDGSALLPDAFTSSGLYVYQANCVIKYLAFDNFTDYGVAFDTYSATNNTLQGCYVGVDATGTNARPNNYGAVAINGAHTNIFGPSNVISGNLTYGILIRDTNSGGNIIRGNYVGLDATGMRSIPNRQAGVGVWDFVTNTVIGGTNAAARNVISGNSNIGGIYLTGSNVSGTVIQGNYIGPTQDGMSRVTNGQPGIYVQYGPQNTLIGGTNAGAGNLISGNGQDGIFYFAVATNAGAVIGNLIGTDKTGTNSLGNNYNGINIAAATQNLVIGGTTVAARNVVSGNLAQGIMVSDPGTAGISITGNYVGVATNGTAAVGNVDAGIYVTQGPGNVTIGGTNSGAPNVIAGNTGDGVAVYQGAAGIVIQGNNIGTDKTGTVALANQNGVNINGGSQGVMVGGTTAQARNLISGNRGQGVIISDATTTGNLVVGNFIGVATNGTTALGNGYLGVYLLFAPSNTVGGTLATAANVISGNTADGVVLYGNTATQNVVAGNYIGVDLSGTVSVPNTGSGLSLNAGAVSNTIGGATAAAQNVICANSGTGVYIAGAGTAGNLIENNYIGISFTTPGARIPKGNGFEGLSLFGAASNNLILSNIIAANMYHGIFMSDAGTSGNIIQGNSIGLSVPFAGVSGNGYQGIRIQGGASNNVIGLKTDGSGAGNTIAFNTNEGIIVFDAVTVGNVIRGNSIYSNAALGINLVGGSEDIFGTTANDANDTDTGPNRLQNFPVITSASVGATTTTVTGTLNSTPSRAFALDFYRNVAADASGHGQGQVYMGGTNVTTAANGNASFSYTFSNSVTNQFFVATATDLTTGDTSEFSAAVQSTNAPPVPPPVIGGPFTYSKTNGFGMNLALTVGQPYHVQGSTNLATTNWVNLTNFTAGATNFAFVDHGATNLTKRFYRVVSP